MFTTPSTDTLTRTLNVFVRNAKVNEAELNHEIMHDYQVSHTANQNHVKTLKYFMQEKNFIVPGAASAPETQPVPIRSASDHLGTLLTAQDSAQKITSKAAQKGVVLTHDWAMDSTYMTLPQIVKTPTQKTNTPMQTYGLPKTAQIIDMRGYKSNRQNFQPA